MNNKELSKRQLRKDQVRRREQRSRLITIGVITVAVLFVAFLIIYPLVRPIGDVITPAAVTRPDVEFNTAGNPDAPITITEYSDFQCPYCRIFYENTEALLMERFVEPGTVHFVYKSVGSFIGPESKTAAEAAYCAGDQGKFWDMHDIIFANQTGENAGGYTDRRLEAFAEAINLDMDQYSECMSSGKYADLTEQDAIDAREAGIQATPSFIITYEVNGETQTRVIQGAQSIDVFAQEIDAALAEIGQ